MTVQPEEKVLEQVRKMLDRANHPNTPDAERETCIRMADAKMAKYAIDQAMLDAAKTPEQRRKPVQKTIKAWDSYVWASQFITMIEAMARMAGVRSSVSWEGQTLLVGMADDVDYVELLWTNTYLAFLSKIDPRWEQSLSFEHNVYNHKLAGIKWKEIAEIANAAGHYVEWPDGGRLIRAYKHHCKILGESPTNHTQRHGAYRQSFVDGFVRTVCTRLEEQTFGREEAAKSSGAELVLVDKQAIIDEAYFEIFPDRHPDAIKQAMEVRKKQWEEDRAAEAKAREEMLEAMTDKQRKAFLDAEERKRQREQKANERYWRNQPSTYDSDGARAGRRAGQSVDLSRSGGRVGNNGPAGEL